MNSYPLECVLYPYSIVRRQLFKMGMGGGGASRKRWELRGKW